MKSHLENSSDRRQRLSMTLAVAGLIAASMLATAGGCASDEQVSKTSGDKRTVRQAEPLRDIRNQPPTVTGAPR